MIEYSLHFAKNISQYECSLRDQQLIFSEKMIFMTKMREYTGKRKSIGTVHCF